MRAYSLLTPEEAPAYRSLAFPRHAALLVDDLGPGGTTVAVGASCAGVPCALALAGPVGEVAALYAIVVAPHVRRRRIGTQLITELEAVLRTRGVRRLIGSHRGDRPDSEAVTRLLARSDFARVRSVVELVYPVARLEKAPVLDVTCRGAELVPFTPERVAPLLELQEPPELLRAAFEPHAYDPDLSVLVALDGETAGCMLARRIGADVAYCPLLYVRPELRRRTRLAAWVLKCFLRRLTERGVVRFSCDVSLDNTASLAFTDEKLGVYACHRAVVHIVAKTLCAEDCR